jgi:exopolyphosphatase / guanosine-5'-triphosphate,3'-diphosphate pyrophosphatase
VTVAARWEWRTFGADLGPGEQRLASLTPDRVGESDETYVLGPHSDASIKARDGRIDVKHLLRVADDGLEQWMPILKASFPLSAEDVHVVLETLRVGDAGRGARTLKDLAALGVIAIDVHKRRAHYTVGGCMTELTEIRAERGIARTIAVEDEDPDRVRATVRDLGLSDRPVVCMARGLKTLMGFGSHRYAVIDVGTNSVKFHVAERSADGAWSKLTDRAEVTRLGEGLDDSGRLQSAPIVRTVEAIAAMADEAGRHGAGTIAAVGTAGLRIAPNGADVVAAVEARCGVGLQIIPGDEEARLAYGAARAGVAFAGGSLVVFDTGGGSSQFTYGDGEHIDEQFSVNVGAARFTERFGLEGPISEETLAAARTAIAADLGRLEGRPAPDAIVGMGGANTNLAAVMHALEPYDADVVQGTVLTATEIDRQIELYRTRTADQRREIAGLQPARAEVILAGACIVRTVLALLGRESLTVSDRGLRHGVLAERFGLRPPAPPSARD